ncbi:MAG: DUF4286 family protein [Phycisphaerales bacterium]|nr:DUF4286 family protein [Phycisphaerales bacterium]
MNAFYYFVRIECDSHASRDKFVAWLRDGHYAAVIAAGALTAELIELDLPKDAKQGAIRPLESRYAFASREAFAAYEAGPAVTLRAEGLAKFPPSCGVRMTRSTGDALFHA